MRIASHQVSHERLVDLLRRYARRHPDTILFYDLGGDAHAVPGSGINGAASPANEVTLADVGRLVVINARLDPDDVRKLTSPPSGLFEAVPAAARLQDATVGTGLYDVATRLYDAFRFAKIGAAKRSKLLHIKRPWLIPISDSRVNALYSAAAAQVGREMGGRRRSYWEAIRRDLVDGEAELMNAVAELTDTADERLLGRLTPLRLLDIVAWQLADADE
jgi:Family of unknown function (DUF6308)